MPKLALASILAVSVALAACSRSEAPPAPPQSAPTLPPVQAKPPPAPAGPAATAGVRVASVALGSALDPSKRVVAPRSSFAPTDTIYASVDTQGWNSPVTLTARWTYEDGQLVNESSQQAQAGPGTTEFHISKPSGWPAGSYQVEILADGSSAATQRFEVR
jgi:hypothetical protein